MIDPVLVHIGPIEIRWYGLLFAAAFLCGYYILIRLVGEKGWKKEIAEDIVLYMIPAVVIGARLFEVFVYEPGYYLADPVKIFYVWQGGLASHGGMLGAVIALWFVARKYKLSFYGIADLVAVPFVLCSGFIRLGNFINGELVGRITNVPWAVKFPGYDGLRHPSQLYEMINSGIVFGIVWFVHKKKYSEGFLFWLSLLLYSILRFSAEFFKEFPTYYGLDIGQYLSFIVILISAFFLVRLYKKK